VHTFTRAEWTVTMTDEQRAARNAPHLENLPWVFRRKVKAIIAALEGWGWRPVIVESIRTVAEQQAKVDAGVSRTMKSKHLKQPDGCAHAVDMVCDGIWWNDGVPGFVPFAKMQANAARSFGCRSGYWFRGYHSVVHDFAHIQWDTA